jgi:hypothetical protein
MKQTLKYKYTRKECLKKLEMMPESYPFKAFLKDLLAKSTPKKKSKEIKEIKKIDLEWPDEINKMVLAEKLNKVIDTINLLIKR